MATDDAAARLACDLLRVADDLQPGQVRMRNMPVCRTEGCDNRRNSSGNYCARCQSDIVSRAAALLAGASKVWVARDKTRSNAGWIFENEPTRGVDQDGIMHYVREGWCKRLPPSIEHLLTPGTCVPAYLVLDPEGTKREAR